MIAIKKKFDVTRNFKIVPLVKEKIGIEFKFLGSLLIFDN